jgi:hypothetical protein
MGGNALRSDTIRLTKEEYFPLYERVSSQLRTVLPNLPMELIAAFQEKATFGDMDIIMPESDAFDADKVAEALGATEYIVEGETTSFGVPTTRGTFQLDLMQIPPASYDFAKNYYAMNDLGNLIGVAPRRANFKLGHLRMSYLAKNELGATTAEIEITKSWPHALALLSYDLDDHQRGVASDFRTKADFFKYATSSIIFDEKFFFDGKMNSKARARIAKRATHSEFIDWLRTEEGRSSLVSLSERPQNTESFLLKKAIDMFPPFAKSLSEFREQQDLAMEKSKISAVFRQKYKAAISPITEAFKGGEVSLKLAELRKPFANQEELEAWVIQASDEDLATWVEQGTLSSMRKKQTP